MKASEFDVPVRVVLRICYGTGFRLGEVLNLIWSDVEFDESEISITPKPWWQPKTDAAIRTVFAPELTEWLGEYRRTLRHAGVRDRICQQDEKSGKPWGHRIHERLRRVYERAGISGKKPTHSEQQDFHQRLFSTACNLGLTSGRLTSRFGSRRDAVTRGSVGRPFFCVLACSTLST